MKNVRAAPRVVPMKSAHPAADHPAMTAAVLKAHADRPHATAATSAPTAMDGRAPADLPVAMTLPGPGLRAAVKTAREIACAAHSARMTVTDLPAHPIAATTARMTGAPSAANGLRTDAAMAIGLRVRPTAVPTVVPTGPIHANRVPTSDGTMIAVRAPEENGTTVGARSATSPRIGRDKAAAGHPNGSKKPNLIMYA